MHSTYPDMGLFLLSMNTTVAEAFAIANRCHAVGQLSEAEQMYWYVLGIVPNHAEALHQLGIIAQRRSNQALAIDYFTKAVACDGANPAYLNNLGVAYISVGNIGAAVTAIEQALQLRPDYAEALSNLGIARQQQGDLERAVDCFVQAIRHKPSYAEAYANLGNALHTLGKAVEARRALEQALSLNPDNAEAANNLGLVLHEAGEIDRAIDCYRRALRIKPDYADASNNLATALKEQGLLDEAIVQYRETLKFQPDHALACYNLSQFASEGRFSFSVGQLERIKAIVAAGRGSPVERSLFCFALAGVLAQTGSCDAAFDYYQQANDLRKQSLQDRNRAFDVPRHRAVVDGIIADFDESYFQKVQSWGTETNQPIFIVGMPRSGSTLVEQILSSHPHVFGAGELGEIPRLVARLAKAAGCSERVLPVLPLPNRATSQGLAAEFLQRIAKLSGGAERVTIKTLENCLHLGVIATLFPGAHIIHCRRDPLDVCLSCYFQNFQGLDFAWSMGDLGAYHRQYERVMAHWRSVLPLPIHDVSYEELIHHPEAVVRDLLSFCGLSWEERCLAFYNTRRTVRTASTLQVRKPLSAQSIGRWKRYRAHLEPLMEALDYPAGSDSRVDAVAKR